uniref:Gustatory receptor n=1 Tax=Romanomermis culicivorax TaxID=13658 RepID=A0A915JGX2_ROMCU
MLNVNIMFSFLALSVERLYASFFYQTYAETNNCWLALAMMIILYSLSAIMELMSMLHTVAENSGKILCDSTMSGSTSSAISNFVICVILELAAILTFAVGQYRDKVKLNQILWFNTAQHSLKARFQLSSNLNLNNALMPCIVVYFITSVVQSISILIAIIDMDVHGEGRHRLGHWLCILSLIYSLVQGIMLPVKNSALEKAWSEMMLIRVKWRKNKVLNSNQESRAKDHTLIAEKYFQDLAAAWDAASPNIIFQDSLAFVGQRIV